MIRPLIVAVALTGCTSHNTKDTHAWGDLDRDGCIAYRCQMYCKADATPEQVSAFRAGTVDELEKAALGRLKIGLVGDTATTVAALSLCEGVKELNPLLGASSHPLVVIAYNGIAYVVTKHAAEKSPVWCSSARQIRTAANVRAAASINNAVILAICP